MMTSVEGRVPLGTVVRALRRQRQWTQVQLAAKLGITQAYLCTIEGEDASAGRGHNWETVCRMAEVFGVTLDTLRSLQLGQASCGDATMDYRLKVPDVSGNAVFG